jgi:dipeptidyl aminopeptidase/acylaminoacyl peptidase
MSVKRVLSPPPSARVLRRALPALGWLLVSLALLAPIAAAAGEPFTPEAALGIKGVDDPQFSPDGKWVVYRVSQVDLEEDRTQSYLRLVPADGSAPPRRLTLEGAPASNPAFSPDGGWLLFLSKRDDDEASQLYVLPLQGGEAMRVTDFPGGVSNPSWSPDGARIAFLGKVYPDCETLECTAERDREKEEAEEHGPLPRRHTSLLYRHWTTYDNGKVKHLFVVSADGGDPVDITPGLEADVVQWPLAVAHSGRDYEWSPDGRTIALATNLNQHLETNYDVDLYLVPSTGGELRCLTQNNPAADATPRFSPDGKRLAYRASVRPGYEADRYRLRVMDLETGETREITSDFDRQVGDLWWGTRGKNLYFLAGDRGQVLIHKIPAGGGEIEVISPSPGTYRDVSLSADGKRLVYTRTTHTSPDEVFVCRADGSDERRLSSENGDFGATYDLGSVEEYWFEGAGGVQVQGWIVRPPGYDPSGAYPLVFGVHGGPEGMYGNRLHTTYQILASHGYVVVFTNPRGSTGYGQEFTDGINLDWGGKVMEDLMKGLDAALERVSVDRSRMGATGWSYGGYAMNWLLGHTDRFAAVISGAGISNLWSFYGSTEELFFPEWEMGGTPWENPELLDRLSPIRYADRFETPTLIIHGDGDFRVPVTEGEQMFTALQRHGVPSEFLRFHDEGHWISRPTNRLTLYRAYPEWFDRWLGEEAREPMP